MYIKRKNSLFHVLSLFTGSARGSKETYTVCVLTTDKKEANASGDAWIVLRGEDGSKSKKTILNNGSGDLRTLGRGQMSDFKISSKDLGPLKEITLGLTGNKTSNLFAYFKTCSCL